MIDPDRSRRPSGFWRSLARPRRSARPGTMPAGLVLVIVVGALLLAMFGNADATLRKSEGKPRNAQWRTDVADRIASVSDFLHLTSPRSAVDSAMGRTSETKTESIDELLAQQQATQGDGGGTTDTTADLAALTPKIRTPTPTDPLTLWVGGDSVTETFGTSMVRISESTGLFKGVLDFHVSTGLAVPSYFNWPEHLVKDVIPNDDPDVVVIMFGANDGQNIKTDDGRVLERFSPEWYTEYQSRVGKTMDLLRSPDNDRLVMWLGPPPMGPSTKTHGMDRISYAAWTEAKSRPWVDYVDTWPFFSNADLQFVHSLPNADGEVRGMRQKDDIHMSTVGGDRLAWVVMTDLGAHIDLSATRIPTPPASQVAPPGIKERDEIPESIPGAI
ncbi:MAG: DUF459 domain-containing protein [Acidimicrobiales bacterium]